MAKKKEAPQVTKINDSNLGDLFTLLYYPQEKQNKDKVVEKKKKVVANKVSPGIRKSLRCSKQLNISLCTTRKNIFVFQSEHSSLAFVAAHNLIVCTE